MKAADEQTERVRKIADDVSRIVQAVTGDDSFQVRLFGSWATGKARPHSDIDIAIDGPRALDSLQMFAIREACDGLPTLFTIDLVDLNKTSHEFREAIRSQIRKVAL
jgi:predicted nucleotidyltransferase